MCGTSLWGLAGAVVSAYFAYLSYAHLSTGDYSWVHSWWTVLTYAVWVVLITGLLTETPAWSSAPEHAVRQLRMASTVLWALAAIASFTTTFGSKTGDAQRDSPEGVK